MSTKFPHVSFIISEENSAKDGIWKPEDADADPDVEGDFQINVFGTREHYLRLADAIRQFAESKDSHGDNDHHEHFEDILNCNGKIRLHIILRKNDVGDSIFQMYFPKDDTVA